MLITIKDCDYASVTVDAETIICVCANKSKNDRIRSLVMFDNETHGFLFSVEERDEIMARINKALQDEAEECIGLTD
jgi:hypothetical protein